MSATILPYVPTVIAPTGGMNPYAGIGMEYAFTLSLTGSSGGEVTIVLTDQLTGFEYQIGAGNVTSVDPTFIFTFNNKVFHGH
jgi:outer membrane protein W